MLLVVLFVVVGVAVLGAAGFLFLRPRRAAATDATVDETAMPTSEPASEHGPAGLLYGLIGPPGPDYAPQPVFAGAVVHAPQAPHRPVVTSPGGTRPMWSRRGAHRRGTDAEEIARLEALHESGALSEDEMTSLKARLSSPAVPQ